MKQEKGVTLLVLVITIAVMLIIAGIGIYSGQESIKKANLESLKTNMLLIQAKAREYVEQVSFKAGRSDVGTDQERAVKLENARKEVYETNGKLIKTTGASSEVQTQVSKLNLPTENQNYYVPQEALNNMGLSQVKEGNGEYFILSFNETNLKVEVYNTLGFDGKYSLTDIDNL